MIANWLRVSLVAVLLTGSTACSLFTDSAAAGRSCKVDNDCFVSQGEGCVQEVCCAGCYHDAAPIDATPADASLFDAGPGVDGNTADSSIADGAPDAM